MSWPPLELSSDYPFLFNKTESALIEVRFQIFKKVLRRHALELTGEGPLAQELMSLLMKYQCKYFVGLNVPEDPE